ncbi:metallophosphatase family protein [Flavobacterium aquidurense]|uniref:metallophosphoesterase family protein n=1 Tax=Flavobacterium aquidurense TaxID=362413 RepID=UPI0009101BC6|nr:metallophosphoesterase family protein [Flavobacterium aquidurense]OXA74414.1 metallophosphatase family protein [Flavobacterium aquidurense]SHF95340.1 Predicted phosphodiesterase [Flavobacterium frigidimaris]
MIQIAIISDIHANVIALNEVLKDIENRSIYQTYCLGDLVDFAPWGNEVIEKIKNKGIPCLLGNHDERIASDHPVVPLAHHDQQETANRFVAINHSKAEITSENKKWLAGLPYNLELTYKINEVTKKILLVHAGLLSNDTYIYEADSKNDIAQKLKDKGIEAIIMGHTHLSYQQKHSGVLFVNSGSVGRSRERDRKATYCLLTITEKEITAEIIKVDYDIQEVAQQIYNSAIPDFYGDFLLNK